MIESTLLLVITKSITLICGGLLTFVAVRAYRRTGAVALRALAMGLGLVTVGGLLAGALHQGFDVGLVRSANVQSTFTAVGLAVLTYSIFARPESRPD